VLHEIASCLLALRILAEELREAVVVLQAPAVPGPSTGTNVDELMCSGSRCRRSRSRAEGRGEPVVMAAAARLLPPRAPHSSLDVSRETAR
jgi:dethiobiotin synthetase